MLKLSRPAAEVFIPDAILHAETLAAVIVTDGRGSSTRLMEQKRAASQGNYAVRIWLDHPSADVKQAAYPALASDLSAILSAVRARFVYTHNPVDFSHTSCFA